MTSCYEIKRHVPFKLYNGMLVRYVMACLEESQKRDCDPSWAMPGAKQSSRRRTSARICMPTENESFYTSYRLRSTVDHPDPLLRGTIVIGPNIVSKKR